MKAKKAFVTPSNFTLSLGKRIFLTYVTVEEVCLLMLTNSDFS